MPSPGAALRFIGDSLSRRIQEASYDPEAVTSWETGDLSGKMRMCQSKIRAAMKDSRALKYIVNCSRRLGKTFMFLADALEIGLKEINAPLKFAAPTQKQMKKIILPIFREITLDCPSGLRPIWKAADQTYIFPKTRAELAIAGCSNGHEEGLRGTACRKAYVDEAQSFKNNLKYVVQDILMPQVLTTGGSIVIGGTPPRTPVHDFARFIAEGKAAGNYIEMDILQAGYPEDIVEQFIAEAGGRESTTCRREYFCEVILDEESAIIPEWRPEYERTPVRDEFFQFYHKYEAMDIGGRRDRTVNLFGWYDFKQARLYVDAEAAIPPAEMTTQRIADVIRKKEIDIFGEHALRLRVADNNNEILLKDLGSMHRLHFVPTSKDELQAMVNQVRLWVGGGRIIVNPACSELIGCLRYGIWNEKRDEFERFAEESDAHKAYGHFDALAALVYFVRNIDIHTNPIPPDYKMDRREMFVPPLPPRKETQVLRKLLGHRFRR